MSEREQELISEEQEKVLRKIGSGFGAKIYLVERPNGERLAKKVFDPNKAARIAYRAYKWREHPFTASYASHVIKGAYELRRVGHRLTRAFNIGVEIVDAVELCRDELGFYSPFIEAPHYSPLDIDSRESLNRLERHFSRIGLPVWSFGGYLKEERRKRNVLVDEKGKLYVVDYEAGWPYFSKRDLIGFDDVQMLGLQRFLVLGHQVLRDRLGDRDFLELMRSWEKYQLYSKFWRDTESAPIRKAQLLKEALSWRSLNERLKLLLDQGKITPERAETIRLMLSQNKDLLDRVKPHILAHFLISLPLRFPFGTAARIIYTTTMRAFNETSRLVSKRKREKIQIHDGKVAVLTACPVWIPPFTFFAYLIKVLGEAPLSYLILDNISFRLSGKGLEKQMEELGSRRIAKVLVKLKDGQGIPSRVLQKLMLGIEKTMAGLLSGEVVEKASFNIRRGATLTLAEKRELFLNEELLQELESAIDQKYLKGVNSKTP